MATLLMTLTVPDKTGGSRMALQFATALREAGHNVILAHGPEPQSAGQEDRSILGLMRESGIETRPEPGLTFPVSPAVAKRLSEIVRSRQGACVIGVHQRDRAVALAAARRAQVPGVVCAQNQHRFWGPWPLPWLKEKYYAHCMRRNARLVICTSEPVQDEFVKRFRVVRDRTQLLSNGIDVLGFPNYSPDECRAVRRSLEVMDDEFLFLNVGRINIQKGQDVLLRALAQLGENGPAWKLVLVGDVPDGASRQQMLRYRQELLDFTAQHQLGSRVRFVGWREDVPLLLRAADAYVHAARYEGSPLAVLEALAASRPTITPDNTSRPPGLEDGAHGMVVRPEDPVALGQAMQRMRTSSVEERARMGAACRALAESKYDIRVIGRRFVELVEGVIDVQ